MTLKPVRYIGRPIEVDFDKPPLLEKKPTCPSRFILDEETFEVEDLLEEWVDYSRRGRMARNMQPQHAMVASHRGSWGVGRWYYRVCVADGRIFELYYDRAPRDADTRKGGWMLVAEYQSE